MKTEKPNSTSAPRTSEAAALVRVGGNLGGAGPEGVSVDKIRDLLFGNQMQDYDRRFANLEERFLSDLRRSSWKRRAISALSNPTQRNRWTC